MYTITSCPSCGAMQEIPLEADASKARDAKCTKCGSQIGAATGLKNMPDAVRDKEMRAESRDEGLSLFEIIHDELKNKEVELPTMPHVAVQILEAASDPDRPLESFAEIVGRDSVIASKVVSLANSSFYRGLKEINNLPESIKRIGFNGVRNIAVAIGVKRASNVNGSMYNGRLGRFWVDSIGCALAAGLVAEASKSANRDEAFLAGLVQDIGSIFIIHSLDEMGQNDPRVKELPEDIFKELLNVMHESIGAELLRKWNFPRSIIEAVWYHHRPKEAGEAKPLAMVLSAADLINLKIQRESENKEMNLIGLPIVRDLRLKDIDVARIIVSLEEQRKEMIQAL